MTQSRPSDRAATIETWARYYAISMDELRERLKEVSPSYGPNKSGEIVPFYWELDVRRVCADLLSE